MNTIQSYSKFADAAALPSTSGAAPLSDDEVDALLARHSSAREANPAESRDQLDVIDWRRLQGSPPDRVWWIQDWLTTAPTLLAGAGGIGKSLLLQAICTALATGRPYIAPATRPLRCMLWACEDDFNEIWRRQVAINRHFGVDNCDLENLVVAPRVGRDNVLFAEANGRPAETRLMRRLQQAVDDLRIDVLVIDNLAHTFAGRSEDRHQVTTFVNRVQALGRGRDFAPILVGHPARAEGSEFAGSAAWENAVRSRWYLGTNVPGDTPDAGYDPDARQVYLARRKANYALQGYVKLRFTDGVLGPTDNDWDSAARTERLAEHERIVMEGFLRLRALDMPATDAPSSPSYLPKKVLDLDAACGATRRELASALNRLVATNRLQRKVIGKHPSGADRTTLVLPS